MARVTTIMVTAALLVVWIEPHAGAWPYSRHFDPPGCPRPSYSPLHYWTPELVRVHQRFHSPQVPMNAMDLNEGIPAPVDILKYKCPGAPPPCMYLNTGRPYDPNSPFFTWPGQVPESATPATVTPA
jgi:hypothetical protein